MTPERVAEIEAFLDGGAAAFVKIAPEVVFDYCRELLAERKRDQLARRVEELEAENVELRSYKFAVEQTPKQWSTAQAPTLEAIAQTARGMAAEQEVAKLREAIRDAGFAVMQTSGKWSIHDVSEKGKADDERTAEVIARNVDLEVENVKLRAALEPFSLLAIDNPEADDGVPIRFWSPHYSGTAVPPTMADCRRAAQLLSPNGNKESD